MRPERYSHDRLSHRIRQAWARSAVQRHAQAWRRSWLARPAQHTGAIVLTAAGAYVLGRQAWQMDATVWWGCLTAAILGVAALGNRDSWVSIVAGSRFLQWWTRWQRPDGTAQPFAAHGDRRLPCVGSPGAWYYAKYQEAQRSHWWFRGREQILQLLVGPLRLSLAAGDVVADVGSGPGGPSRRLFPQARIAAFDLSAHALAADIEADWRVMADACRLPCARGRVAAICAFDVLEHLDDDLGALREWRQLLRPGGWLVLTVPAYQVLWSRHDEANGHRRRYRAPTVHRLLVQAGFSVVRLTYFNSLLLPGVALVRWTARLIKPRAAAGGQMQEGELDFQRRFPGWVERCCHEALGLEARWLRRHGLPVGVSIGAVARVDGLPANDGAPSGRSA